MHNPREGTPKHYFFVVSPTGTGKSLLWELFPLVNDRERKTAVIISPTRSLSLACAAKAEGRYGSHSLNYRVVTEYLDGQQQQQPDLIFLSVSAFSKVYESICKDPHIACIFIDEFQFIVSDFEFCPGVSLVHPTQLPVGADNPVYIYQQVQFGQFPVMLHNYHTVRQLKHKLQMQLPTLARTSGHRHASLSVRASD